MDFSQLRFFGLVGFFVGALDRFSAVNENKSEDLSGPSPQVLTGETNAHRESTEGKEIGRTGKLRTGVVM